MQSYFKYFFVIFFLIIGYLAFLVIQPFIPALLTGGIMAYMFFPVYKKLVQKIKRENVSALLISLLIIFLLSVPTLILVDQAGEEARFFYLRAKQRLTTGNIFDIQCQQDTGLICKATGTFRNFLATPEVRRYVEDAISKGSSFVLDEASQFIFSLPRIMLNLFVAFFVCFYLLKEGPGWIGRAKKLLPIKPKFQQAIFKKIDNTTYAVIYGSVLVALIQGGLGALGFFVLGVNAPILWGILMAIFALVPFLGTAVIWLPTSLLMMIDGYVDGQQSVLIRGILLLLYGTFVISTIDNILKPRIIAKKAEVHPVLVLVGVLGGLAFLGFIGFIIGPLILALFDAFLDIYEKEKKNLIR